MSIMEHKNLIIFIIAAAAIITIVYFAAFRMYELNLYTDKQEISMSDDTSISVIEKDLAGTEIIDLDKEFTDIDAELETAINEAQ